MSNLSFRFIHIPKVFFTLNSINLRFLRIYVFFPYYTTTNLLLILSCFVHIYQIFKIITPLKSH